MTTVVAGPLTPHSPGNLFVRCCRFGDAATFCHSNDRRDDGSVTTASGSVDQYHASGAVTGSQFRAGQPRGGERSRMPACERRRMDISGGVRRDLWCIIPARDNCRKLRLTPFSRLLENRHYRLRRNDMMQQDPRSSSVNDLLQGQADNANG